MKNSALIEPTSKIKRFLNWLLDTIFMAIISFILGIFLGIILGIIAFLSGLPTHTLVAHAVPLVYITTFILYFLYYTILEAFFGKTFGKFITRTKVIQKDGSKPKFISVIWRTLGRWIPFDWASFFIGARPVGWHDGVSKTMVIDDK
jgi:uncharacterized RDD family membrane protein YckC